MANSNDNSSRLRQCCMLKNSRTRGELSASLSHHWRLHWRILGWPSKLGRESCSVNPALVCFILVATAKESCQICGDVAAGFHCGAFVCEACKKFYIRTSKQTNRNQQCSGRGSNKGNCQITRANRTSCTYCRYQKCLNIGMEPPGQCTIVACDWSPERWWLDGYASFFLFAFQTVAEMLLPDKRLRCWFETSVLI